MAQLFAVRRALSVERVKESQACTELNTWPHVSLLVVQLDLAEEDCRKKLEEGQDRCGGVTRHRRGGDRDRKGIVGRGIGRRSKRLAGRHCSGPGRGLSQEQGCSLGQRKGTI